MSGSSENPPVARPWSGVVIRMIFSIMLAYPVSGAANAIYGLIVLAWTSPKLLLDDPGVAVILVVLDIVLVPLFGGFVPANEGDVGPRINMYPWIVPTAFVLFFLSSRGWLWFKRRRP
jgi:hypothetical protein